MENVKKCKSFLSTLIKLASSGKQSTETAANVKELVQNLLVSCSGETLCLRAWCVTCSPCSACQGDLGELVKGPGEGGSGRIDRLACSSVLGTGLESPEETC